MKLFRMINKILNTTLVRMKLNTTLCFICAKIEVFANIQAKTIIANCIIWPIEVPCERIYMAAAAPKQLWPITAIVAEPI